VIKATYIDHCGSDLNVVNAARVSFGKESEPVEWQYLDLGKVNGDLVAVLSEKDQKLIHYLAKHEHYSPFGHCFASFHVKAPIFVARQLVKHKFLRWNEISRRYVDDEPEFYVPDVWRGRSADKKQGSADWSVPYATWPMQVQTGNDWDGAPEWTDYKEVVLELYQHLLSVNVAPEQARMVLPQSCMTEFFWSGSLDAFADMCNLRLKPDAQYETRLVAEQISEVMRKIWPISWEALMK
jgi:thymidylate synthase (FAD)